MEAKKTSTLGNGLIWFGAAVSIAEILTGTYIAPLGMQKGMAAILLGHLIGCLLFCLAGLIGGQTGKSAMETVKMSFGSKGALLFAVLNVLQLVGWTAIMIINGAQATTVITGKLWGIDQTWIWCLAIGALIILWVAIGIKNIGKLNYIAMGALFILTIILSTVVFKGTPAASVENSLSFGAAVELSAAMPLSWLPLISGLHAGCEETVPGHRGQYARVFCGQLLDVCHWNGSSRLYRRNTDLEHHASGRARNRRCSHPGGIHGDNDVSGCIFSGCERREHIAEAEGKADGDRCGGCRYFTVHLYPDSEL